jgi:hypothetical protein
MKHLAPIALSILAISSAGAQTVYKSIDAQGNVTYSSTPPPEGSGKAIREVPIAPPPPESQRQEAEERVRQLQIESARIDRQREGDKKQRADSVAAAEKELQEAQMQLEEAKIRRDEDWQYLATGGRVLKQSYLDRVDRAEKQVRQAEQRLQTARGARP